VRLLGRMRVNAATYREGCLEEQERILGGMRGNAATFREGCLEEWERILGRRGVNAATFREGYYGSSGELLRQIGRIPGNIGSAYIIINRRDCCRKREGMLRHLGKFAATKGENL